MEPDFKQLYKRYNDGDIKGVWQEIIEIDEMNEPLNESQLHWADELLRETMQRVRHNVVNIIEILCENDYQFVQLGSAKEFDKEISDSNSEPLNNVYVSPDVDDQKKKVAQLEELVQPYGTLPLSFKIFLEEVGGINLIGYFPNLSEKDYSYLDPLMVFPLDELIDYHEYILEETGELPRYDDNYYVEFSYDAEAKEGVSGSGLGYGICLEPFRHFEGEVTNFGINIYFVDYLRLCIQNGGFPDLDRFSDDADGNLNEIVDAIRKELHPF